MKKKVVPVVAAPTLLPVEVASSGVAPADAIGALTAGGDSSPAKLQEAADMVAGLEKRIATLPHGLEAEAERWTGARAVL